MTEKSGTHAWGTQPEMFGPRHEHRLAMIVREAERLPRGARILDGAIGLGTLAAKMQQRGHRVFGIDSSFESVLYVKRTSAIPAVIGDMTRLPFRGGAFDGVTTGETLEHLDDDAAAAAEIARVLRDGGTCIATVPAMQVLWNASDVYSEHRRRYSRAQLESLCKTAGLEVLKSTYWGFPIILAYDLLFLVPMNKRRARRGLDEDPVLQKIARAGRSRALMSVARTIFSIDALFAWVPFGPGLLLVGRKVRRAAPPHHRA